MREVSTAGTRLLLRELERRGIALEPILRGLPVDAQLLSSLVQRIDWEVWIDLLERIEASLGGPEQLEAFLLAASTRPGLHPFQRVARLFSSPEALYHLNSRWGVPNQYRHMRSTCTRIAPGQLRIDFNIPPDYRGSSAVFRAAAGVLRGIPLLIGLPEAQLFACDVSSHGASVVLQVPQSETLWSRARKLGSRARGLASVLDQLWRQELELDAKRLVLEQQLLEQKRVEAALRASEDRWRGLAENAPGTIVLISAQGLIKSASRAFHGSAPSALSGRPFSELFDAPSREPLLAAMRAVHAERTQQDVQLRRSDPDGAESWYACRLGPLSITAPELELSAFLIDVTARRRAEAALLQREAELARAQKLEALGLLAGGVAHDFNNLLTIILGGCELVLSESTPDEPHFEMIAQVRYAGERAAQLTRQLLAFSRQQVGSPKVMDLGRCVGAFEHMLARLLGEDVLITLEAQPEAWPVKLDTSQVEQILINLSVNARDAMPRGGTLKIATHNRHIDAPLIQAQTLVEPGDYVELVIEDTGLGMDEETLERIFEPFYTTKPNGRGTGLGLAIVRGITTQNGGHLFVDSQLGRGTSFRLLFPRSHETPASPSEPPERARGGSETILLVEDDPQVRAMATHILGERGYTVLETASANDAIEVSEGRHIDLLLSDVVMPDINGPELARLLIEKHPHMAVLFMSGYAEHDMQLRGIVNLGSSLVVKPFGPETLAGKVRQRLDETANAQRHSRVELG